MKKSLFTIVFLIHLFYPLNLKATHNELDSLCMFLEQIGEDSATVSLITNSPDAQNPDQIIDMYLSLFRLGYDCNQQKYEWYPGWGDSLYVCKFVEYLSQRIVQDTALCLAEKYLQEVYLFLPHNEYATRRLLDCAEYSIVHYHSRYGYLVPDLYYHGKEANDWQNKLQFYEMTKFVISSSEKMLNFDMDTNKKINAILAEPNELSPHYMQFRSKLKSYSDMELARITNEQKEELASILRQGIVHGEKKSQLTYAFMLLTGQFVEKNEKYGKELLSRLLK